MSARISLNTTVDTLAKEFANRRPLRAGGLVITVFGDLLMPRGGAISTQSLMDIMALFGVGNGVVRTALSRLSADGMFASVRSGRRSFYHLTETAWDEYEDASQIIYAPPKPVKWNGDWLVVLDVGRNGDRISDDTDLRKGLHQLGFAKVGGNVYLRPSTNDAGLRKRLDLILDDQPALVIDGQGSGIPTGFKGAVESFWDVEDLSRGYAHFVRRFEPLVEALGDGAELDGPHGIVLRTLAIHEFRQLVLKDPQLPLEILPANWSGDLARTLCADLYAHVFELTERWVGENCVGEDGALPPASGLVVKRFGGIS